MLISYPKTTFFPLILQKAVKQTLEFRNKFSNSMYFFLLNIDATSGTYELQLFKKKYNIRLMVKVFWNIYGCNGVNWKLLTFNNKNFKHRPTWYISKCAGTHEVNLYITTKMFFFSPQNWQVMTWFNSSSYLPSLSV